MRKFLSLMLAMALIITTLALPVSVSAAAGKSDANITVSYTTDLGGTEVHPGDTFNLTVSITSDKDVTLSKYSVNVKYDKDDYTITGASDESYSLKNPSAGYNSNWIQIFKDDANLSLTAEQSAPVATIPVTVANTAVGKSSFETITDELTFPSEFAVVGDTSVSYGYFKTTDLELTIAANTSSLSITAGGKTETYVENKTYIAAEGVTFKVTGTNITSVKYKKTGDESEIPVDVATDKKSAEITEAIKDGTYTVTVSMTGTKDKTYTFTVSTEVVAGQMAIGDITTGKSDTGYKAGSTFTVPVTLVEIGENKTGMASFNLTYDSTRLELTSTASGNVNIDESTKGTATVSYGTKDNKVAFPTDGVLANLSFKVIDNAPIGKANIKIDNPQLTISKENSIEFTNDTCTITNGEINPVVVPEKYATVTSSVTNWVNNDYDITVTKTDETINLKYVLYDDAYEEAKKTQAKLKAAYEGDGVTAVENNTITIDTENKHYVIISEFNGVYSLVADLAPGVDVWLDKTAPAFDGNKLTALSMSKFEKSATLNISDVATDTNGSGIKEYKYLVVTDGTTPTADTEGWAEVTDTISITISTVGKLYIKATDNAGNVSVSISEVNIKVDADAPNVSVLAAAESTNGVPLTITANDTTSDVTVKVYFSQTQITDGVFDSAQTNGLKEGVTDKGELTKLEGAENYTYTADTTGYYYIYATDEAGNQNYAEQYVELATITKASDIQVKVLDTGDTYYSDKFEAVTDENAEYSNGTFGYVGIKVVAPTNGFKNTITVKINDAESTLEGADGLTEEKTFEFKTAGAYEVTVTTTHSTNASKSKAATYKFTIADGQKNMVAPTGEHRYGIGSYAMMQKVVTAQDNKPELMEALGFEGKYSGDLDGNFEMDATDVNAILTSIKGAGMPGYYNFGIMCGAAAPTTTQAGE